MKKSYDCFAYNMNLSIKNGYGAYKSTGHQSDKEY